MIDPDIRRVKNNEARMRTHNKEKERKHAMDYEYFAIKKHIETNPSHKMYHWSQIPENLLEDSGYIHMIRMLIARSAKLPKQKPVEKSPKNMD